MVLLGRIGHLLSAMAGAPERFRLRRTYECGFGSLGRARRQVPLLFFAIAILFLLFDLELLALMPLAIKTLGGHGSAGLVLFFAVLTAGFWVEWRQGAIIPTAQSSRGGY